MRTTIDKAGRLVVPKVLRDQIGLAPGEVDLVVDGTSLRIDVVYRDDLTIKADLAYLPQGGPGLSLDEIRELRFADQR